MVILVNKVNPQSDWMSLATVFICHAIGTLMLVEPYAWRRHLRLSQNAMRIFVPDRASKQKFCSAFK